MSTITVVVHFELSGLKIRPDVVGKRREFEYDGHGCTLAIPSKELDFGVEERGWEPFRAMGAVSSRSDGAVESYYVQVIRVEVKVESSLTAPDFDRPDDERPDLIREGNRIFEEGRGIAVEVARRYANSVRIKHQQWWLGSSSTVPNLIGRMELYDAYGARIPVSFHEPIVINFGPLYEPNAIWEEEHQAVLESVAAAEEPSLGNAFLADAIFADRYRGTPDRFHAVLLAAIACEVRIKRRLRELATPEQEKVVDLILENYGDFPISAEAMFDKALRAVCGRSLRLENLPLYKATKKLFEDRNRIAHRGGEGLDIKVLDSHVATAQEVFAYLDSLP